MGPGLSSSCGNGKEVPEILPHSSSDTWTLSDLSVSTELGWQQRTYMRKMSRPVLHKASSKAWDWLPPEFPHQPWDLSSRITESMEQGTQGFGTLSHDEGGISLSRVHCRFLASGWPLNWFLWTATRCVTGKGSWGQSAHRHSKFLPEVMCYFYSQTIGQSKSTTTYLSLGTIALDVLGWRGTWL